MSPTPQRRCDCKTGEAIRLFDARDYVTRDRFEIIQCSSCGLAFTDPVPAEAAWRRYYPKAYYGSPNAKRFPGPVEWLQNVLYTSRARKVETLMSGKPGRILDIGCGRGHLLRAFQRRGWEVTGTEMSEGAAAYARQQLKLPVHVGELGELDVSFDAIVMWHVLEHFERPTDTLREVYHLLRPGGIFLVAVPNFGSLEARLTRDKWFHLDVPRHLAHFPSPVLGRYLAEAGFCCESTSYRSLEYDFFSAVQSFLNRVGLQHNCLYNALRGGGVGSMSQLLAHVMCLPVSLIPGMVAMLAGGSTVVVYARKI